MRFGHMTAILSDGSLASLVACAMLQESLTASDAAPDSGGLVIAVPEGDATSTRADAARLQAQAYGLPFAELAADEPSSAKTRGESQTRLLLAAVYAAARARCESILWPIVASTPAGIDLDAVAAGADRALLVARLVALDAKDHGLPGLTITVPFIDLTDHQIADLAVDMAVPIETCWWNRFAGPSAAEERKRWTAALRSVGWTEPQAARA
jgi:hypothetical protein